MNTNYNNQAGRKLWSVEWYTLFNGSNDERKNLTWRNRFSDAGGSDKVIQYYSSGEDVLQPASVGWPQAIEPGLTGRDAWNIQEKAKGTDHVLSIGGGSSAGWGFNRNIEHCKTDEVTNEESCTEAIFMSHEEAQPHFDATINQLIQQPYFDRFDNDELHEINANANIVRSSFPRNLGYEIPALSFAAGGTKIASFPELRAIDMNAKMQSGWPKVRLNSLSGNQWHHSDFKDIAYRYTYQLFNSLVEKGDLK